MFLLGRFRYRPELISAITALKELGFTDDTMDLFSREPVQLKAGILDRPSKMSLASVIGAATVGGLATAFVYWAQNNYELVTGGMPTFSWWATGVISFETTMLGAVLATFSYYLWESARDRRNMRDAPVPQLDPNTMVLRVHCSEADAVAAEAILSHAGALEIVHHGREAVPV